MCILRSFVERLQRIGKKSRELPSNHAYEKDLSPDDIGILDELQLFLDSLMKHYNINT